jgi:hypothetical protein
VSLKKKIHEAAISAIQEAENEKIAFPGQPEEGDS